MKHWLKAANESEEAGLVYFGRVCTPQIPFFHQSRESVGGRVPAECNLCKRGVHRVDGCPKFLSKSVRDRKLLLFSWGKCFKCFSRGHTTNKCTKAKCHICGYNHHHLLCTQGQALPKERDDKKYVVLCALEKNEVLVNDKGWTEVANGGEESDFQSVRVLEGSRSPPSGGTTGLAQLSLWFITASLLFMFSHSALSTASCQSHLHLFRPVWSTTEPGSWLQNASRSDRCLCVLDTLQRGATHSPCQGLLGVITVEESIEGSSTLFEGFQAWTQVPKGVVPSESSLVIRVELGNMESSKTYQMARLSPHKNVHRNGLGTPLFFEKVKDKGGLDPAGQVALGHVSDGGHALVHRATCLASPLPVQISHNPGWFCPL